MKILCKNSCVFENKHFSFFISIHPPPPSPPPPPPSCRPIDRSLIWRWDPPPPYFFLNCLLFGLLKAFGSFSFLPSIVTEYMHTHTHTHTHAKCWGVIFIHLQTALGFDAPNSAKWRRTEALFVVVFREETREIRIWGKYAVLVYIYIYQGLLYHRTCKPDFLCSWPSLNSYLK